MWIENEFKPERDKKSGNKKPKLAQRSYCLFSFEFGENNNIHVHTLLFSKWYRDSFKPLDPKLFKAWKLDYDFNDIDELGFNPMPFMTYETDSEKLKALKIDPDEITPGLKIPLFKRIKDKFNKTKYYCLICGRYNKRPKCKCNSKTLVHHWIDVSSKDTEGKKIEPSYIIDIKKLKGNDIKKGIAEVLKYCFKPSKTTEIQKLFDIYKCFINHRTIGVKGRLYRSEWVKRSRSMWEHEDGNFPCKCCGESGNFKVEHTFDLFEFCDNNPEAFLELAPLLGIAEDSPLYMRANSLLEKQQQQNNKKTDPTANP